MRMMRTGTLAKWCVGLALWAGLESLGCGYSEEAMQAERERVAALTAELGDARQKVNAFAEENEALEARVESLQRERERQQAECDRMRGVLEELRALEEADP
jgi:predicted RNase H-like nuclease (RuvC/YqgF family)